LLFHLSHLCTESIDILIRVSLPGLEGIVFQKELLKFMGGVEVGLLLLLIGGSKSNRGLSGRVDNTHVRLERRYHLLGLENAPIDGPEPGMPLDFRQAFPMRFAA
jgi:hypothetical protein